MELVIIIGDWKSRALVLDRGGPRSRFEIIGPDPAETFEFEMLRSLTGHLVAAGCPQGWGRSCRSGRLVATGWPQDFRLRCCRSAVAQVTQVALAGGRPPSLPPSLLPPSLPPRAWPTWPAFLGGCPQFPLEGLWLGAHREKSKKLPSVAAASVAPRPWPSAPRREVAAVPAGTPAASELAPAQRATAPAAPVSPRFRNGCH